LELRAVTARNRGGRTVLDGVDLVVPGGTTLAVVGRSGAGKSLLAALAGRLADPDSGEVLLDGVPLRELDRHTLRRAIGYAFERPALLGGPSRTRSASATLNRPRTGSGRPPEPPAPTTSYAVFPTVTRHPAPRPRCPAVRPNASVWQGRSPAAGGC
jgi:ABC-type branched-subunit amino acid transport system ATPase component